MLELSIRQGQARSSRIRLIIDHLDSSSPGYIASLCFRFGSTREKQARR